MESNTPRMDMDTPCTSNSGYTVAFATVFYAIEAYHKELGAPVTSCSPDEWRTQLRDMCLGAIKEITELMDEADWKPWREVGYAPRNKHEATVEFIDILVFLGAIRELWGMSAEDLAVAFEEKLLVLHRRITSGYHTADQNGK